MSLGTHLFGCARNEEAQTLKRGKKEVTLLGKTCKVPCFLLNWESSFQERRMEINTKEVLSLIADLVRIPSPTGYSKEIISFVSDYLHVLGYEGKKTNKGAYLITIPGTETKEHRLLTAHVDTLGAMVKEIKSDGRLKLSLIGGTLWNHVEGEYCKILTGCGKNLTGTIMMHQTSVHVYRNLKDTERSGDTMEVRLDAEVTKAEDTEKLGVGVGDFVVFDPRVQLTDTGFIKSRHLDDKASAGILLYLLKELKEKNTPLPYTTHFLFSTYEEVGHGGNSNIPEKTVEYLAVDMGAIGDGQATDEYTVSICAKDSSGPYDIRLREHLVNLAKTHDIGYKVDIYPYYGSDASGALSAGYDIIHGLIGPGIDGSHAFERTHEKSLEQTTKLLYHYIFSPMCNR